jgi:uncharacterized protein YecE (DUF72 family)
VSSTPSGFGRATSSRTTPAFGGLIQPDLVTTAPFTYFRVHRGIEGKGFMGKKGLRPWAARVRALTRAGKDVYFYFNNDQRGYAVKDAMLLREMVTGTSRTRPR